MRRVAVALTVLGALLIILSCTRTWATVDVSGNLPGLSALTVSGRRAAPAGIPVALAALAGAIVLLTSGRVVRAVVAVGLIIAGAVLAEVCGRAGRDTSGAVSSAIRDSLGVYSRGGGQDGLFTGGTRAAISIWPWVACLGAVLIVAGGLLVLARGWSWPGPTRRYERTVAARANRPAEAGPIGTWDALSRGEDPTSKVDDPT